MRRAWIFLLLCSSTFGQGGQNVKGTFGFGAPASTIVPGDIGSQYVDTSTGNLWVCSAVNLNSPPSGNGIPTCTWAQVGTSAAWQNQGSALGTPTTVNCSTNLTCTFGGGTVTIVASSSASTAFSALTASTNSNVGTFAASGNVWDFNAATSFKVPVAAGAVPTASGLIAYDSTANKWVFGQNTATVGFGLTSSACAANTFVNTPATSTAAASCAQPAFSNLSGTITSAQFGSQTANFFLAAPNGSAGNPTFRAVVAADIPTLNQNTTGTAANLSGTPALPNGTTATTQTSTSNDTKLATDAYVDAIPKTRVLGWAFGDVATGATLTTSEVGYITSPIACTITGWHIMADAGTVTIKTARVNGGTALPTLVSNSISTSGVALSTGTKVDSTTVTDFTSTAIAANDTLGFFITAVATAKQITFQLDCKTI